MLDRVLDLNAVAANPDMVPWQPFRQGVQIYVLHEEPAPGSSSALLRYAPGADVPSHTHVGFEHIYILSGAQEDDAGHYPAGSLVINAPGTRHSVRSPMGCIALLVWQSPVRF